MIQKHLDENAYTDYSLKIRHAALMRAEQAIADLFSEDSTLSDDFKFWMHFELIRHLSARFAAADYAAFSGMALSYLSEENAVLRDDLSPANWPMVDVDKALTEAAEKIEFWKNVVPNSGPLFDINGVRKRLYPVDEKYV